MVDGGAFRTARRLLRPQQHVNVREADGLGARCERDRGAAQRVDPELAMETHVGDRQMMVPVDDRTVLGSQQLRGGDVGRRQTGDERNDRDEAAILWHGVRHSG